MRSTILVAVALSSVLAGPVSAHASTPSASTALGWFASLPDGPSPGALRAALAAYDRAIGRSAVANPRFLTIIDYTLPSVEPRLWVLDLVSRSVLHRELVAHGRGSGDNLATEFSNRDGSHQSSLGLFVTDRSYMGRNGYSLRLRGLDAGVNDRAWARAIVMHGASYVSEATASSLGRLGRSWGCPAVRTAIAREIIDTIKGGSVVFAFGHTRSPSVIPTVAQTAE